MAQSCGDVLGALAGGLKVHKVDTGQRPGLGMGADRFDAAQRSAIGVKNVPRSKRFAGLLCFDDGRGSFCALAAFLRAAMALG